MLDLLSPTRRASLKLFQRHWIKLSYPQPAIRLLGVALESMESYEKSGFVRTREHRCPAERRDNQESVARAQKADHRRGRRACQGIYRRRLQRFPARPAWARGVAEGRKNPSLRSGVLPRYGSHRPRCRVPDDHPRRASQYGKQIIIKGRDYVNNPENKFTVTVLGAVAELERAKIIERTTRGRLHRLRMGELSSNGHRIYGYDYVRKTATAPAALVINEEQAPVVWSIFEMFASGRFGLVTISRSLEERRVPTRLGRPLWQRDQIKSMLKNETYAGTRYFNRITAATEASREGRHVMRGRWVYRDRAEWIPVKVPPIVSRELLETVHAKLRLHEERYCRPLTHYLLQGLVQCGVCGSRCSSSRGYHKVVRPSGRVCVYHRAAYRCNRRAQENMHDRTQIERCRNSEIGTHILEGKVFEMIREIMLDPGKLRGCIETGGRLDDRSIARELARVAGEIRALEEERRRLIDRYAAEQMAGEAYIAANRALDRDLERFAREKAELVAALQSPQHEDFVDASIRHFCASARARFQACADFDAKREFLVRHVERVIYNRYKVTIAGSVLVQAASGGTKLQFQIKGEIDRKAVRSRRRKVRSEDGWWKAAPERDVELHPAQTNHWAAFDRSKP
jgi:site-specific DNA recombinase